MSRSTSTSTWFVRSAWSGCPIIADEKVRCGGNQIPASIRGMNSSAPGATARQHGADAEMIGRLNRERHAWTQEALAVEIIVPRVAAAVRQRDPRRDRK